MTDGKFSNDSAVSLHIGGVSIKFPVKPYPSQLSMMNMIIKGLERKQHCLLESPTGSGKSLALLCSALAWQKAQHDKYEDQVLSKLKAMSDIPDPVCTCRQMKTTEVPTTSTSKYFDGNKANETSVVDLCSDSEDDDFKDNKKTVPQKAKEELCDVCISKRKESKLEAPEETEFKKPRVPKIWFGTRTHKQIAQITKELGRTFYGSTNMTILSSRQHSCIHPAVMKSSNKNEECKELRTGTHASGARCAFYQNVNRMKNHHQLNCAGMSHAWDLEELVGLGKTIKACPFYSARELVSSSDIIFCPYNYLVDPMIRSQMQINLNKQIVIMDEAHNVEDSAREAGSFTMTEESLANTTTDLQYLISDKVKENDHKPLHLLCTKLGQWVKEHSRHLKSSDYETSSDVWFGRDIIEHLNEWGITQDTLPLLQGNYSSAIDTGEESVEDAKVMHSSSQATLGGLFNVLRHLMVDGYKYCDDYRITIIRQAVYGTPPPKRTRDGWITLQKKSQKHFVTSLNFWCLNPAVAFNDLKGAHCIILTSGTLSPMSSFSSELGLSFPIQLEANHVIQESQVWVGAVGKGPKGTELEATYRNTDRFEFQDELGELIHEVCHIIPHGVLCFFSSYSMMKKLEDRWKVTGIWDKITEVKEIICEPRSSNKEEFASILQSFYDAIHESESDAYGRGGALMFAVCRGKVSEGLDFADNNARAVITVGIPFPSIKDKQVELKRKYNDIHKTQRGLLSGGQWYEIQAYRAMNQALGRCIRHKNDWGALLIVDERFCKSPQRYAKGLSKWVRQKMRPYPNYDSGMTNLKAFVQKWTASNNPNRTAFPRNLTEIDGSVTKQSLSKSSQAIDKPDELSSPRLAPSHELSPNVGNGICMIKGPEGHKNNFFLRNSNKFAEIKTETPVKLHESTDDVALASDDDFKPKTVTPNSLTFAQRFKQKLVNGKLRKKSDAVKCEDKSIQDKPIVDSEIDFFNNTIAQTPEKITVIPESPSSSVKILHENGGREITSDKVRQRLFNGMSAEVDETPDSITQPTKTRCKRERTKSGKMQEESNVKSSKEDQPERESGEKDSGELLPRKKRMKRKSSRKKSESFLSCCSCDSTLYKRKTNMESKSVESSFISSWVEGNGVKPSSKIVQAYCMPVEKLVSGSLKPIISADLNSHWCEEEERCYRMFSCTNCSKALAFQIVSEEAMKSTFVFPIGLVSVDQPE